MRRLSLAPLSALLTLLVACGGATGAAPPSTAAAPQQTVAPAAPAATSATSTAATAAATGAPKPGGTLVVGKTTEATNLDTVENSVSRFRVTALLYDNLVDIDKDLKIRPMLAESWSNPDSTTYFFKLRKGVKFHNGREMTADDVKYTVERIQNHPTALQKQDMLSIKEMVVMDPGTIKMSLKAPNAGFLAAVGGVNVGIVAKEVVEKNGDLKKVEAGTGPYVLESWAVEQQMKMKKFPDYWDKSQGFLDSITFQIVPDEANIVAGLRAGTIQFALLEDNKNYEVLSKEKSLAANRGPRLGMDFVNINAKQPPLDNVKVRQALSYAVDRKAVLQAAAFGLGQLTGPLPPVYGDWALSPAELDKYYTRDVAKSKQLLAESGVPQPIKLSLWVLPTFPTMVSGSQVVAANLKEAGVEITLENHEYANWIKRIQTPNFEHQLTMNLTTGYVDPDSYLYFRYHTDSNNINYMKDKEVDQLLQRGRETLDPEKRREIYLQLQRLLLEKVPQINLFSAEQINVMAVEVKGFVAIPNATYHPLRRVWLEK